MSIESNIEARRIFTKEVLPLIESVLTPETSDRFWELTATHAAKQIKMKLVSDEAVALMTEKEAEEFENTKMQFGKYAGMSIGEIVDIDIGYLTFIAENEFQRTLVKWMKTRRFKEYQDKLEAEDDS